MVPSTSPVVIGVSPARHMGQSYLQRNVSLSRLMAGSTKRQSSSHGHHLGHLEAIHNASQPVAEIKHEQ